MTIMVWICPTVALFCETGITDEKIDFNGAIYSGCGGGCGLGC